MKNLVYISGMRMGSLDLINCFWGIGVLGKKFQCTSKL